MKCLVSISGNTTPETIKSFGCLREAGLTINFDFKYDVSREPCKSRNYTKVYLGVMK